MDNRPIGVFDSGLGGLTAVRALRQLLPHEDLIYFGDTARVPYGGRSRETLLRYARQDIRFLRTHDLKAVLIACGTVSTPVPWKAERYRSTVISVMGSSGAKPFSIRGTNRGHSTPHVFASGHSSRIRRS